MNYTYHFSDSFYRNWFTGRFHSSNIFSFFPFNWLKLWYFQYFLCFSSSESYFMVKLRCMDRSVSLRDFDWLISDEGSWSRWVYLMGSSFKTNGSHAESWNWSCITMYESKKENKKILKNTGVSTS